MVTGLRVLFESCTLQTSHLSMSIGQSMQVGVHYLFDRGEVHEDESSKSEQARH